MMISDREKVIKKLEECLSASCRGFRTCPYSDADWDAVKEALALLKEQEPIKPRFYTGRECWCGQCGGMMYTGDNYCSHCGRKVLWDG